MASVHLWFQDLVAELLTRTAIEPYCIVQTRSTEFALSFAAGSMTDGAIILESLRTQRVARPSSTQRKHVIYQSFQLNRLEDAVERRHDTGAGFFHTGRPYTIDQSIFDCLDIAAPLPIRVKIRIAESGYPLRPNHGTASNEPERQTVCQDRL